MPILCNRRYHRSLLVIQSSNATASSYANMNEIRLETLIEAPADRCFELSLSIDIELEAAKSYCLRAISGVTSGKIGPFQRVRWQSCHFGFWVTHESEITRFERPICFQDTMVSGIFRMFQHDHVFLALSPDVTEMHDILRFSLPGWTFGSILGKLVVEPRLCLLMKERNSTIKCRAEGQRNIV